MKKTNRIIVSDRDARRLRVLVDQALHLGPREKEYALRLLGEIDRADIVPHEKLPEDVIALYSEVELEDLDDGEISKYTLVFPEEADVTEGKISILAPIGTGMLGFRVGNEFKWETPGGEMRLKVRKVTANKESGMNLR